MASSLFEACLEIVDRRSLSLVAKQFARNMRDAMRKTVIRGATTTSTAILKILFIAER